MNSKLEKFSVEELNKKIKKLEKLTKTINIVILFAIILAIISFLLEGKIDIYSGGILSVLILALIERFFIFPKQIEVLKLEIDSRKDRKEENSNEKSI